MPKHPESSPFKGYLSVDDLMHSNYPLLKTQRDWLKNYSRLWMLMEANVIGFNIRRFNHAHESTDKQVYLKPVKKVTNYLN